MTSYPESNNLLAFRILRDSKLKHPDRSILETFLTDAVDPDEASTYLVQKCPSGPNDNELAQFVTDWKALIKMFVIGDSTPTYLDSETKKKIMERDDYKCCLTGQPSRFLNPLSVVQILPCASLHIREDRLNDMLGAFISPSRRSYLRSLSQPLQTNLYRNHWVLSKAAADVFSRGEVKLDEELETDMYSAYFTGISGHLPELDIKWKSSLSSWPLHLADRSNLGIDVPDPQILFAYARFAKAIKWLNISSEMTRRRSLTNSWFNLPFKFDLTAIWLGVWLKMPAWMRIKFYKTLRVVGSYIYGPSTMGVQRLPFWMYLKHGPASHFQGHAGEFGALKLVRTHTSIPVPRPIDHVFTSECSYLVTSQIDGEPAGIDLALCSDDETAIMVKDLQRYVRELRAIPAPVEHKYAIINTLGCACLDYRISCDEVGPFADEQEFNNILHLGVAPKVVHDDNHKIVFTHGDLNMRNILAKDGRISGIVDWENAGWYPEYWEYTKCHWGARRNQRWLGILRETFKSFENFQNYEEELIVEKKLWDLAPPF